MKTVDRFTQTNYFALIFILVSSMKLFSLPLVSGDVYVWLASGLKMLQTLGLDKLDTFSVHPNVVISYPSHLSSILYAWAFKLGGPSLLFIFCRIIGVLFLCVVYKKYLKHAPKNIWNLLIAILSCVGAFYMLDRPAFIVSFLIIATLDHLLSKQSKKYDYLIYYVLVVAWTNLHPSSLVLLPFLLVQFIFTRDLKKIKYAAMTLLGVLTNPIHYKIFSYALMTMEISKKRFVGEWRSVFQFHDYYFLCLFLVLLSTLLIQIYKKKKMNQYCSSGLILFAAMALINARHVALFSLTVLPTLHYLNLWKDGENIITNVFHQKIILGSLVLLSAFLIGKNYYQNAFMDKDVQLDIVHYLDNKENLRIFNDGDGGVLSVYLSHNHSKIFFDTRNIIFNDEIYEDYFKMKTAVDMDVVEDKYQLNAAVINTTSDKLIEHYETSPNWLLAFKGNESLVFMRR